MKPQHIYHRHRINDRIIDVKYFKKCLFYEANNHFSHTVKQLHILFRTSYHLVLLYFIFQEKEQPYLEAHGDIIDQWKQKVVAEKQAKMPGKGKRYTVDGRLEKRRANVGNNLQNHITVEDSLKELIRRDRWA